MTLTDKFLYFTALALLTAPVPGCYTGTAVDDDVVTTGAPETSGNATTDSGKT